MSVSAISPTEDQVNPAPPPLAPAWTTVPFYIALASYAIPIVTLVFHNDYSDLVPGLCAIASALATVGWMIYEFVRQQLHHMSMADYHNRNMQIAINQGLRLTPTHQALFNENLARQGILEQNMVAIAQAYDAMNVRLTTLEPVSEEVPIPPVAALDELSAAELKNRGWKVDGSGPDLRTKAGKALAAEIEKAKRQKLAQPRPHP